MGSRAQLLRELEAVCSQLDITLRYEKTSAKGGLCKVDDSYFIIVDRKASEEYKIHVIGKALKQFDLSNIHLKPKLREFLDDI